MWRQNVASLAHAVSGAVWCRQTWRQNVASLRRRGVTGFTPMAYSASQDVASDCASFAQVASESHVASQDRTWRQNVASCAIDLRGFAGRGVNTWHQEAQAFREGSSKRVFSRRAICAAPQATPCMYMYTYMHVHTHVYFCTSGGIDIRIHICASVHLYTYTSIVAFSASLYCQEDRASAQLPLSPQNSVAVKGLSLSCIGIVVARL